MAARAEVPDVIVMDMPLSDVPGREAIGWLRALPGGGKTALITLDWQPGVPAAGQPVEGLGLGLTKPVSTRILRQAISRILAGDAYQPVERPAGNP